MGSQRAARVLTIFLATAACSSALGCGEGDPGGIAVSGSIVGTYVVDEEAMRPAAERAVEDALAAEKEMLDAAPPSKREGLRALFGQQKEKKLAEFMSRLQFQATLAPDGTFVVVDGDKVTARGKWQLVGSTFTAATTEANGVKLDPPDGFVGTYEGGRIRYRPNDRTPFDIVMRPK